MIFIVGVIVGSFINLCAYRIPRGESIVFHRSYCDNCKSNLKTYELVPIIGYILSKGRCKRCNCKISKIYPIIELVNGIIYLNIFSKFGYSIESAKFSTFISIMIIIAIIDFKTKYVYSGVTVGALIIGTTFIIMNCYVFREIAMSNVIGALLGLFIFLGITKITGAIGEGDIEVASVCGLFLGIRYELLTIFLAYLLGGIVGVLAVKLKVLKKKDAIAFTPFLMVASIITIFWGENIINWYFTLY